MARIRTVKPEVYRHEGLFEIEKRTGLPVRLFWIGLFAVCDREGRFKWRPGSIKLDVLPFDDVDVSALLDELWAAGFLVRYRFKNEDLGCIPTFPSHQVINHREAKSNLPPPSDQNCEVLTRASRVEHASLKRPGTPGGKGREGKGKGKEGKGIHAEPRVTDASPKSGDRPDEPDQTPAALIPIESLPVDTGSKSKAFIEKYCDMWAASYHEGFPPITGQDAGIAKRLMKTLSIADAHTYLEAYFSMPDAWLVKSKHPLPIFETRLKEIAVYARSGAFTTKRQASQQDDLASNLLLLQKIRQENA